MKPEDREKMIVIGVVVPFLLCMVIFVIAVMRSAFAHAESIPQVEQPAVYRHYGPEIPVCDEPLWERIKDRCVNHEEPE